MAELVDKQFTTGYRPKQNIPESSKDKDWAIRNIDWCISLSPMRWQEKESHYYDIYNGVYHNSDYKAITEMYGIEFPAGKLKHIPLIRPLLNALEGEFEQRAFNFQVRAEDTDSVNSKLELMSNQLLDSITQAMKSGENLDVALDGLEKYYKEDFQTETEIASHHALKYYTSAHNLKRLAKENFIDKIITGKQYYRVEVNRIGEDPIFTPIRPGSLNFANNNERLVKNCDWAVYPTQMSPTQVLDSYGERMTAEDRNKIENWIDLYYRDNYKVNNDSELNDIVEDSEALHNSNSSDLGMLTVYNVEWKSIRAVYYVENPNKYASDAPFIKYIPENKLQTLKGDSKKNLRKRYVQDLWQGKRVGDDIYFDMGRVKYATRKVSQPSKVYLTFNGPTYNGKIKPYSLIKETEDLQNLYNVLHYHKENLIAISGVKGMVMDASQIPDFGSGNFKENLKMWLYYKKLGTAWIDRSQEGVDKSYNQFGTYDDTLGPGLEAILAMITHIEELASRIIGINRQRLGAMSQRDGKGVTENAIMQSALTTEPIFAEHDEFMRQAMEDVLDACKVAWKNGYTTSYVSDQYLQQIFTWNPEYSLSSTGVYVTNGNADARSIEDMKAFAFQLSQQGMLEFEDIMPLFRKSNLKDIQYQISNGMDKRKKEMAEKEAQAGQLEAQLAEAKGKAEIEKLQAEIQKLYAEAEDIVKSANLDERKLEQEASKDNKDVEIDRQKLQVQQAEVASANSLANSQAVTDAKKQIQGKRKVAN